MSGFKTEGVRTDNWQLTGWEEEVGEPAGHIWIDGAAIHSLISGKRAALRVVSTS